jgi:hypothetical protein
VGGPGKVNRIARAALLILLSPAILTLTLIFVIVQAPSSIIDRRRRVRRQKSFAAQMEASGRLVPWAELPSQLDSNSQGTLIEEDAEDDLYNIWWTPEDIATLSPHPCCFDEPCPQTMPNMEGFRPFFEWCRSRFTSPESGKALLVDVGKDFWSFCEGTRGRPRVHIKRLP